MTDNTFDMLVRAEAAEKEGRPMEAIELFRSAGALEEASRVYVAVGRPLDAAQMLRGALGVPLAQMGQLAAEPRRVALKVAVLLFRGGETAQAVDMLLALGENDRAILALERANDHAGAARLRAAVQAEKAGPPGPPAVDRSSPGSRVSPSDRAALDRGAPQPRPSATPLPRQPRTTPLSPRPPSGASLPPASPAQSSSPGQGDSAAQAERLETAGKREAAMEMWLRIGRPGDAARLARQLGRLEEAGKLFADAGQLYEAAQTFRLGGDRRRCLEHLLLIPHQDTRYRKAAQEAISLSAELNQAGPELESFLQPVLRSGPQSERELELLDDLSRLYIRRGMGESAKVVLRKMMEKGSRARDAARRLTALEEEEQKAQKSQAKKAAEAGAWQVDDSTEAEIEEVEEHATEVVPPAYVAPEFVEMPDAPDGEMQLESVSELLSSLARGGSGSVPPESSGHSGQPSSRSVPNGGMPGLITQEARSRPSSPARTGRSPQPTRPVLPAPSSEPAPAELSPFAEGVLIATRYKLEEKIGQGGMATVFRALDLELEEQVALKVFSLVDTNDAAVARFKMELKLSRQLTHPNVIRLYDIGVHQGHRYISMELLRGQSLKTRMAQPFAFLEAVHILEQACHGLQVAHDQGVIHRDIKPDNFFLTEEGILKVMDFGIAKHQDAHGMTLAGSIAGTPAYMSPEQINNFSTVTYKTDIYALGITAYELFTGTVPFTHPELIPMLLLHINEQPELPRLRNPGIPEELEALILRMLEKDPAKRPETVRLVGQELEAIRKSYGG